MSEETLIKKAVDEEWEQGICQAGEKWTNNSIHHSPRVSSTFAYSLFDLKVFAERSCERFKKELLEKIDAGIKQLETNVPVDESRNAFLIRSGQLFFAKTVRREIEKS